MPDISTPLPAAPAPSTAAEGGMSLLNLAARQRMLSQRMVLQTLRACRGDPEQLAAAWQTLTLFTDSQRRLESCAGELPPQAAQQIQALYHGPQGVAPRIAAFVQTMQATLRTIERQDPHCQDGLRPVLEQMDPVLEALNEATSVFDRLARQKAEAIMRELTDIVTSIQTVAREAKIVSFNAQVMAARAGVHGREFAVVAHALSRITADIDAQAIKALALVTASRPRH
ncbi:methyl-accepting chemotaxis protein [Caldimonas sp.]|uniref:methyl-accepting chemotaxis protein n=1 Tax=Caldimonas sp. TaxID=2838790 RepID=UPI00307F9303